MLEERHIRKYFFRKKDVEWILISLKTLHSPPNRVELEEQHTHTKRAFLEMNIFFLLTTHQEILISKGIV